MYQPKYSVYAVTNIGEHRKNNEDNFFINTFYLTPAQADAGAVYRGELTPPFIVGVSDGMGGENHGEQASYIAVSTCGHYPLISSGKDATAVVSGCVSAANDRVCGKIRSDGSAMGATLSILYANGATVASANIGDSRIYRFARGELTQISVDHTLAQFQVDAGLLTKEQAAKSGARHGLTQYLGIFPEDMLVEPAINLSENHCAGDVFLLCSDGLTDGVDDAQIRHILKSNCDIRESGDRLIQTALDNGGRDNITVMLLIVIE